MPRDIKGNGFEFVKLRPAFQDCYADNKEFYTGTVADNGTFGTTIGTHTITNGAGQLVGSYTVFADGVTTQRRGV